MSPRAYDAEYEYQSSHSRSDDVFNAGELLLSERVCPPGITRQRGSSMMPAAIVIVAVSAAAWGAIQYPQAWQRVKETADVAIAWVDAQRTPAAVPPAAPPTAPEMQPVAARDVAAAPGAEAGTAVPAQQPLAPANAETVAAAAQENPPEVKPDEKVRVEPLTPPTADPSDPNQKRALAAGLHPDLSRALLARMTPVDYRNGGIAVRMALTETADDDVYTWPRDAGTKHALFEVRFVEGAGPECRRYVVTVTLDRWSTTALPMEKCGADLPKRKVARKAAG